MSLTLSQFIQVTSHNKKKMTYNVNLLFPNYLLVLFTINVRHTSYWFWGDLEVRHTSFTAPEAFWEKRNHNYVYCFSYNIRVLKFCNHEKCAHFYMCIACLLMCAHTCTIFGIIVTIQSSNWGCLTQKYRSGGRTNNKKNNNKEMKNEKKRNPQEIYWA